MIRTKLILMCCRQVLVKNLSLCKHPPKPAQPTSQPRPHRDPHNTLHLSPTDVTLRNAIFHTKQCLIGCAHIPSADPCAPHSNYQTVFHSPKNNLGTRLHGSRGKMQGQFLPAPSSLARLIRRISQGICTSFRELQAAL